jgi:hypothetical protein
VSFADSTARTVFPAAVFANCLYTFTNQANGQAQIKTPGPDGTFALLPGRWSVEVIAYGDPDTDDDEAATGVSEAFTVTTGQHTPVTVTLTGKQETGAGTFAYRIRYPEGTTVRDFTLLKLPDMTPVSLSVPTGGGTEISGSVSAVPAGFYLVSLRLSHPGGEKGAGKNEAVHIYNALTSEFGTEEAPVVFAEEDFAFLPLPAPSAPTVTVAGAGQLSVSWTGVTGATSYEVWYNTLPVIGSAVKRGDDIIGTSATITSLDNPTYFVWINAKNAKGTSDFSPMAQGRFITPIASATDMAKIGKEAAWPLNGNYVLTQDIALNDWTPIGTLEAPFTGRFNGNNKRITLNSFAAAALSGSAYLGIFASLQGISYDARAELTNIKISSAVNQQSSAAAGQVVGLLTARAHNALIDNIALDGTLSFSSDKTLYLGGVAGILYAGTVAKNCVNDIPMNIQPGNGAIPGLPVSGNPYSFIGGIVGQFRDGAGIEQCHNRANLSFGGTNFSGSQVIAGGIAGGSFYSMSTAYHGYISDCSSSGNIVSSARGFWAWAGGIAGCIVGDGNGTFENTTRIVRSHASGIVSAVPGGDGTPVDGITGNWVYAGGIAGYVYYGALIEQCYFEGTVNNGVPGVQSYDYTGGIAGYLSQIDNHNSTLRDCWSSGAVKGYLNAGGIVGQKQVNTRLYNCYSRAEITVSAPAGARSAMAGEGAGGIAGYGIGHVLFTSCVALNPSISAPNGYDHLGRIVGDYSSYGGGTIIPSVNSYGWSAMPVTVTGGVPWEKNDNGNDCAEKPEQSFYQGLGWDFTNVWEMGNDGYPHLQWEE